MFAAKNELFTRPSGYSISRSVRTRSSASAYFNRTPASASNRTTWTWSGWVKRGAISNSTINILFSAGTDSTAGTGTNINFGFTDSGGDQFSINADNTSGFCLVTTQLFRDPSAWYHIVVAIDTTQATASNRAKLYVNGNQVTVFSTATYPTQNRQFDVNNTVAHNISRRTLSATYYFDGYMTEVNFIDGQALTPSSFGQTNSVTGVWQPKKYTGTYGTNGFYLNFSDNSAATATTIGKDYSGNGNNWTPNNISVTAGVTYDSFLDVPTPYADGGTGRGNYAVGNPLSVNVTTNATATLTNGNLLLTNASANYSGFASTMTIPVAGKWAWKFKVTGSVSGSNDGYIGFACNSSGNPVTGASSGAATNWYTTVQVQAISDRGVVHKYAGGSVVTDAAGSSLTGVTGDEWEFLIDRDAGTTIVKLNGTTKVTVTGLPTTQELFPFATFYQTSGYFIFDYTPSDTSYKTLNTQNLSTPTISNGANYMAATTYTGTGASLTIANTVGSASFYPDFVWMKGRSGATNHALYDSVRGTTKDLVSNSTGPETTQATGLTAFSSTGFTIGALAKINTSTATYIGWQWLAGAGSSSSNTSGSLTTTVSVNASAGFSVVTYTGAGGVSTIGHGLGVAPSMMIFKDRDGAANNWPVYHKSLGNTSALLLDTTGASTATTNWWSNTSPTSSVATIGSNETNTGNKYVAYCFAAVAGYSAFGSYTGNGSADGPFVYCGFRPRFLMVKNSSAVGNWLMFDSSRDTYNQEVLFIFANTSDAEQNSSGTVSFDFLSNGFKVRNTSGNINGSGNTLIYMAFAENPFKLSLAR